jgi:hypothetical protein
MCDSPLYSTYFTYHCFPPFLEEAELYRTVGLCALAPTFLIFQMKEAISDHPTKTLVPLTLPLQSAIKIKTLKNMTESLNFCSRAIDFEKKRTAMALKVIDYRCTLSLELRNLTI